MFNIITEKENNKQINKNENKLVFLFNQVTQTRQNTITVTRSSLQQQKLH